MDAVDLGFYRHQGHLTVNGVFADPEIDAVVADIHDLDDHFGMGVAIDARGAGLGRGAADRALGRPLQ